MFLKKKSLRWQKQSETSPAKKENCFVYFYDSLQNVCVRERRSRQGCIVLVTPAASETKHSNIKTSRTASIWGLHKQAAEITHTQKNQNV